MRRPDHAVVLGGRAVFELSWPEAPERGGPAPSRDRAHTRWLRPFGRPLERCPGPREAVAGASLGFDGGTTGAERRDWRPREEPAMRATSTGPMNPMKKIL